MLFVSVAVLRFGLSFFSNTVYGTCCRLCLDCCTCTATGSCTGTSPWPTSCSRGTSTSRSGTLGSPRRSVPQGSIIYRDSNFLTQSTMSEAYSPPFFLVFSHLFALYFALFSAKQITNKCTKLLSDGKRK